MFKHKPFHHFHHLLYMSTLAHLFPLSCFSFPCSIFLLSLVLILHHHLTNKHKKHKKDMIKHYTYHHKHKSKHHLTLPCSITMASRGKTMETHLSFSLPFPLSIFGNHKKKWRSRQAYHFLLYSPLCLSIGCFLIGPFNLYLHVSPCLIFLYVLAHVFNV